MRPKTPPCAGYPQTVAYNFLPTRSPCEGEGIRRFIKDTLGHGDDAVVPGKVSDHNFDRVRDIINLICTQTVVAQKVGTEDEVTLKHAGI